MVFPADKAVNTLRGALGLALSSGPGLRVFRPLSFGGPSGFADPPRPFVFRARQLDGQTFEPGQSFHFGVNLSSLDPEAQRMFARAFAAFATEGVGPTRGKATLERALGSDAAPVTRSLHPKASAPRKIRVEFLSPTELKHENKLPESPEFPILFARDRDRVCALRALYGGGPLPVDFQGTQARAAGIRMVNCQIRGLKTFLRSTRTGLTHSLGGFAGSAEYEGDLAEFLPWLQAARHTGVGRQAVWGKGEIEVVPL